MVKEIRDIKTRESLTVTLYTLKFKEPSTDAIRFGEIVSFEKLRMTLSGSNKLCEENG